MRRDDVLMQWVKSLDSARAWRWLDIGAGRGQVSKQIAQVLTKGSYTCYDVVPRGEGVEAFDGRTIPLRYVVDFILFNFVLHHAAENAEPLLRNAFALADTVLIQEDVPDGTKEVDEALWQHDPRGPFLSVERWLECFAELAPGCCVTTVRHPVEPATDSLGYHVPRVLFIVER